MVDLTLAKFNNLTTAPAPPAPEKKRTTLYDAGIIAGTTVLGGVATGVLTNNQLKKTRITDTDALIAKYIPELIEMLKSGKDDLVNNAETLIAPIKKMIIEEALEKATNKAKIVNRTSIGLLIGVITGVAISYVKDYSNRNKETK